MAVEMMWSSPGFQLLAHAFSALICDSSLRVGPPGPVRVSRAEVPRGLTVPKAPNELEVLELLEPPGLLEPFGLSVGVAQLGMALPVAWVRAWMVSRPMVMVRWGRMRALGIWNPASKD